MDKENLVGDENMNNISEKDKIKKTSSEDIYGDYPEEVREILKNSNPLKNRNVDAIEKAVKEAAKEELFSRTRIGKDFKFNDSIIKEESKQEETTEKPTEEKKGEPVAEKKKEVTEPETEEEPKAEVKEEKKGEKVSEKEISGSEIFTPVIDDGFEDIAQKAKKEMKENRQVLSFDDEDDDEPVQMVRHKTQKKEFKRNFAPKNEEIKIPDSVNNTEKKEIQAEQIFARKESEAENISEFDDLKKKFAEEKQKNKKHNPLKNKRQGSQFTSREHEKRQKSYQNRKSPELDNFFRSPRKSSAKAVEKKAKLDKGILIAGGVIIIIFAILFVRNLTLSAKLEEAQQKVTDFEQLQQDNEQLKLNIVALEEKLTKNGISLTDDTTSDENGDGNGSAESGQYDTYTVVSGDTLSGISNKVYGNFSGYKKILEANGLTENSSIQIGQVLKIPKN